MSINKADVPSALFSPVAYMELSNAIRAENRDELQKLAPAQQLAKLLSDNKELFELQDKQNELNALNSQRFPRNKARRDELTKELITDKKGELLEAKASKDIFEKVEELRSQLSGDLLINPEAIKSKNSADSLRAQIAAKTVDLRALEESKAKMVEKKEDTKGIDTTIADAQKELGELADKLNKEVKTAEDIAKSLPKNATEAFAWVKAQLTNKDLIEKLANRIKEINSENRLQFAKSWLVSWIVTPIFDVLAALGNAVQFVIKAPFCILVSGYNLFVSEEKKSDNWGITAVIAHAYRTVAYLAAAAISPFLGIFSGAWGVEGLHNMLRLHDRLAGDAKEAEKATILASIKAKLAALEAAFKNAFTEDAKRSKNYNDFVVASRQAKELNKLAAELANLSEEAKKAEAVAAKDKKLEEAAKARYEAAALIAAANQATYAAQQLLAFIRANEAAWKGLEGGLATKLFNAYSRGKSFYVGNEVSAAAAV